MAFQLVITSSDCSGHQSVILDIPLKNKGKFCGFIFPEGVSFHEGTLTDVDFSYAEFRGNVQFLGVIFTNYVKFHQVQFDCDQISFASSNFLNGFNFSGVSFSACKGVSFNGISCEGNEASFIGATFAENYMLIDSVKINTSTIDFSQMKAFCKAAHGFM